ncbi:MAG: hemagglutinin repeat-containing protein [Pseudomonadota bacterium]
MNKHLHRIIFNARRGKLMVVSEIACSSGKSASGETSGSGTASLLASLLPVRFAAMAVLGITSLAPAASHAQIVADPSAPRSQQATVLQTANGLPQVNIQTPSAAGVSRNTYSQFDVNPQGAILNNSRTNVQTQLGGFVQANPYLATGSARVILNEVNSSNPSQLKGYVEIAGQRAEVIIANPAGINVDGGGFINASRVTLTTGSPVVHSGSLDSFRVQRGGVTINGQGLDTRDADYTGILARAVQVNAGIWTKELKVATGANEITADHSSFTPIAGAGAAPAFALDVAQLGGMYAGKIFLVGTEAGLGARNAGTLAAGAGDFTLQSNGWLGNSGSLQASGNVQINTTDTTSNITNSGTIYATGNTSVTSQGSISNTAATAVMAAQGNTTLQATGAGAQVSAVAGSTVAAGLSATGTLGSTGNLNVKALDTVTLNGQIAAGGDATISGTQLDLGSSKLTTQNATLNSTAGNINATSAAFTLQNTLTTSAAQLLRTDNAVVSAAQLNLGAAGISNVAGQLIQTGTGDTTIALSSASGTFNNTQGRVASNGQNLTVTAQTLNNTDGKIEHAGPAAATGLAVGALTLNATSIDNTRGLIGGNGALAVNNMASATTLNNTGGTLKSALDANVQAQQVTNTTGSISAGRDLAFTGGTLLGGGSMVAARDATMNLQGNFTNTAATSITANRNLSLTTTGDFTNAATLKAGNDLSINAASITNSNADQTASLLAGGKLSTQSATLVNNASMVGAQLALSATQSIVNSGPQALLGATDANGTLELLAPVIQNRDDSTATDTAPTTNILGLGNVVLAGAKDAGGNYSAAAQVLNQSAILESGKNMTVVANTLTNTRRVLTVDANYTDVGTITNTGYWSPGNGVPGGRYIEPAHGGSMNADYIYTFYTTTTARNGVSQISPEARILSGGDFTPAVTTLQNYWSKVSAAGNIALNGVTLDQDSWRGAATPGERKTSTGAYFYRIYTGAIYSLPWGPEVTYAAVPGYASTFTANGSLGGSGNTINNNATTSLAALPGVYASVANGTAPGLLSLPASNLFKTNADPTARYLVETNPAFANARLWLGSDYYLGQLGLNPATTQKRLGDGFYEQQLVRDQVLALTGRTIADGYASAQAQFEQMFAAGAVQAVALNLHPGLSLTAAQVKALTSDVIMLEEREVDVPANGNSGVTTKQKVLVPIVYLANIKPGDLQANGTLIAAANIDLANTQGFSNSGALVASNGLNIAMAQNAVLNSRGGTLQAGGLMALSTTVNSDIDLTSAQVKAGQLNIDSGRNLILATASQDRSSTFAGGGASGTRVQTDLGRIGSIDVSGNASIKTANNFEQTGAQLKVGGDLNADIGGSFILGSVKRTDSLDAGFALNSASGTSSSKIIQNTLSGIQVGGSTLIKTGQDLTSQGASLDLKGGGQITAGGNINLLAVKDSLTVNAQSTSSSGGGLFGGGSASSTRQSLDETLRGSNLTSNSGLTLSAGRDINIAASQVQAQGATSLSAVGNVNITTEQEHHNNIATHNGSSSGLLSSKSSAERNTSNASLAVGSSIGGSTVVITAGKDIGVKGSSVISDAGTTLAAGNNVTIEAGQNSLSSSNFREDKTSGLFASGMSITFGNKAQSTDTHNQQTTANTSTVGAVGGNVNINAGNQYKQVGSDVMAPGGDVNITARQVEIVEARETNNTTTEQKQSQSGLSLGISSPLISAAQTVQGMAQPASQTSDGRMQALAGAAAALNIYNNAKEITAAATALGSGDAGGAASLSISLGGSKSQSNSQSQSDSAKGSSVSAGNNVNITATGAGASSDITIQGSRVTAGNNANLNADGDIKLLAASNTSSQTGTNSASSGSIGLSIGASTGVTVAASKGSGNSNGADTIFTNTQIAAGNSASLTSASDTTLKGAIVTANQVTANVGGNLNIESLQDTSTYTSTQQSVGGSITFGPGGVPTGGSFSASKSNVNSNFQSVGEQSGVKARDGGFNVNVANNTDLRGSVIASTQTAVDGSKNSFTTGGQLTTSDIQNTASFQGSGYSVGASIGTGKDTKGNDILKPGGSFGFGSASGDAAITSSAGISGIAGNTAVRTGDAQTGLTPIFDAQKVQREIGAQMAITAAFGQQASRAIGDYGAEQMLNRNKKLTEAKDATGERRAQLEQEAKELNDNWGEYGTLRLLAHTLIGGLTGGLGGATGAAAGTLAAPTVAQALADAGITGGLASTLTALASTAAGAIAGGGLTGGATAFNEVVNNYLNHNRPSMLRLSERERYDAAASACATGGKAACGLRDELALLSAQRDAALAQACSGSTPDYCKDQKSQAIAMGNVLYTTPSGYTYANSQTSNSLNTSTLGPTNDPRTGTFQDAAARSLAEGLLVEAGNQALGALIGAALNGATVSAGAIERFFRSNGLAIGDTTATRIASNFGRDGDRFTEVAEQMMVAKQANWVTPGGRPIYPPGNGAVPGTEFQTVLPAGTKVDRYGAIGANTDFLAPAGIPLGQRALPAGSELRPLVKLEVLRPLPMQQSNVTPWFGQEGMGVQFQSTTGGLVLPGGVPATIENLIKAGYLKVISP